MSREPINRETPSQFSGHAMDTVKETASNLKDRASDFASEAKDKAEEMAQSVSENLNGERESAARGLNKAASFLHSSAQKLGGGRATGAAHKVADGIESTASYLEQKSFADMGEDALGICRKYPAQAILSSLAIGFLVGRALRR